MSSSTGRTVRRRLSLALRLQLAIVITVVGVLLVRTLVLDAALEGAFEAEDAAAMHAHLEAVRGAWHEQATGAGVVPLRPGRFMWHVEDEQGRVEMEGTGMGDLPSVDWPVEALEPQMVTAADGGRYSVLVVPVAAGARRGVVRMAMDRSHEDEAFAAYRRVLWGGFAVLAVLLVFVARFVAVRGLRPLAQIAEEVGDIRPGRLQVRLDPDLFPSELGALVTALDSSLDRIDDAFGRLMRLSSDLAHELRTPIANVRAEIEAIILRADLAPDVADRIGALLEEIDRLSGMVEQLLFLARAEDPSVAIRPELLAARPELQWAAELFEASAAEAEVRVDVDAAEEVCVHADPQLLRRVLVNVVANAVRHTPAGGVVTLAARKVGDACEIEVSDTGAGFPDELLSRIGERFVRGDPSRGRTTGGAGLGLAIAQRVVEQHGGAMEAGKAPSGGAAVVVRLPGAR